MNRTTLAKRYLPLAAVLAVQLFIIAVVPSTAPGQLVSAATGRGAGAGGGSSVNGVDNGTTGDTTPGATVDTGAGGSTGAGSTSGTAGGNGALPPGVTAKGDTSHCVGGRQFDPKVYGWAPACVPKFTGDNGGATYRGVTKDTIKVVYMRGNYGQAVNAILTAQGALPSHQQFDQFLGAAQKYINDHYELYGRKIVFKQYQISCGTGGQGPPDNSCLRNEMRTMVGQENPFAVLWNNPVSSETYDELSRLKVVNIGGFGFTNAFNQAHAPYHWDVLMDGDKMAAEVGEWWCKRMNGGNAVYAGQDGNGKSMAGSKRVLGVLSTDDPENKATISLLKRELAKCGAGVTHEYYYAQDITTADSQRRAAVAEMRKGPIATSIMCFCDQVAPLFLYQQCRDQNYYPEHVMVGTGNMDDDTSTHSYDHDLAPLTAKNQYPEFENAFGLAQDPQMEPAASDQAARVWQSAGNAGAAPYSSASNDFDYYAMIATLIQAAGPHLTPQDVQAGAQGIGKLSPTNNTGPLFGTRGLGPGDYTWNDTYREIYFSPARPSPHDGVPGRYMSLDGGHWYGVGQYPSGLIALPPKPR
ncbi:MAG: hypothetical protein JWO37_871 [Acidimicrobiales bacterium]|nr:hypothetical protein [Acidimicrobiales bacterium]